MHINTPTGEPIIKYLQRKLNTEYKRKHLSIAKELKTVSQSTISRIARGTVDPTLGASQALLNYFIANEPKQKPAAKKVRA
jgi:predicted transcriptional regulator